MKKRCRGCNKKKKLEDFYRTKRSPDGRQPRCKICMRSAYTNTRNKKKDHYNKVRRERVAVNVKRWREWKEERGCKYCPETFGPCLQLHHLVSEEKEAAVAEMVCHGVGWDRIMVEANKGIVVCGNCHTKIHYGIIGV